MASLKYCLKSSLKGTVTATQSIEELALYIATSACLYSWIVYRLGYQDKEQKVVEERTRPYTYAKP